MAKLKCPECPDFDGKEKGTSEFILLVPIFVLVLLIFINLNG